MSFMCSAGSATATVSNVSPDSTTGKQIAANAAPLMPDAPDLTGDLVAQARQRMGMNLIASSSRNQAFANAPSSGATATYSLLK